MSGPPERRIEDYAVIGDSHSAALVGRDGSIDWLCLPRFDSPACFAALLGTAENGRWQIRPSVPVRKVERRYRGETLVLETDFICDSGRVRVTDFMPMEGPTSSVVRLVTGLSGRVPLRMELAIRFDYGRLVPWVSRDDGSLLAVAGPHLLALRTPVPHHGEKLTTVAEVTLAEGETLPFCLTYGASFNPLPAEVDPEAALQRTEDFWRDWASQCDVQGPWREAVVRSLITLKAMTYAPSGGIVAALTTSLPEQPGGTRNWDYRCCWLRDATFTLLSLMAGGYREEAAAWRHWVVRAIAGKASQMQPLYSILGENRLDEWEVPWLDGFAGSRPVRIGNAAFGQLQLDTFGEVLDALHHARRNGIDPSEASWDLQKSLLEYLTGMLDQPDHGIWEVRGEPQHFTHSKVMSWVALDRAVSAVETFDLEGPAEHWRRLRDQLHREICAQAFDRERNAFVQAYGSKALDASSLLFPLVGFLPARDPRMLGTVEAIERELMVGGLVRRYDSADGHDGLPPGEGQFLACSFWLADNLVLQGRRAAGRRLFERLLSVRNDVGLLAEEYDVETGRQLGNFPQALSHLALVGTACSLSDRRGPAQERSRHGPKT